MIKSKKIFFLDIKKYFYLLLISNFFSILLLSDTTSLNLGLISIQSLIYCLNSYLFIFFILYEVISSYLDLYGFTLNFLLVVFTNPKNLNLDFNFYIFLTNLKYFSFFVLNFLFLIYYSKISNFIKYLLKKKFILFLLLGIIIILFLFLKKNYSKYYELINDRFYDKANFIYKGNLFRDDNWYIVLRNTLNYAKKNDDLFNFSFENKFNDFKEIDNIYIIINESYPNFKDNIIKDKLVSALTSDLDKTNISRFKKSWNKNYSTQGSEMELFCDDKGNWIDFKKNLDFFLKKNNCWINKFYDYHNIFIHSFTEVSFSRSRYLTNENSFFKKTFFKQDLLDLNYSTCNKNIYYLGICENEIINKLLFDIKKLDKKKLIIYLTVENHIPVNLEYKKIIQCESYVLNLHPQFCTLFNNQLAFNYELNNFIKELDRKDLLVFFSDTPPLFSKRDRIHFENYVDVFFFQKN